LQAAVLSADLYRKIAILNRSRLFIFTMDFIERLLIHDEWLAFFEYKKSGGHLSKSDEEDLKNFINNKEYLQTAEALNNGGFFSHPVAISVNKSFSDKKRTVFTFSREENYIQKILAYFLLDYDGIFYDNLYSFRKDLGVKKAVKTLMYNKDINKLYSYKLDISDYFNSVNPAFILPMLEKILDKRTYNLFYNLLNDEFAYSKGETVKMKKGILAGSPLSGFMANLFLSEIDGHFYECNILYARYSDDILFFAPTEDELNKHRYYLLNKLYKSGLSVNDKKVFTSKPGEEWTFLGFRYHDGIVDISDISKQKLKKKMRRKARALYRWKIRKNVEDERAVRAFINHFNKKLYDNPVNNEITWCRWYFPIINTAESLKEIDNYAQQCIRYIATGKQTKAKYNYKYENMSKLGYKTLINSYYTFRDKKYNKS
jgi:hypothetical protein